VGGREGKSKSHSQSVSRLLGHLVTWSLFQFFSFSVFSYGSYAHPLGRLTIKRTDDLAQRVFN
jgi:hypothetical protein